MESLLYSSTHTASLKQSSLKRLNVKSNLPAPSLPTRSLPPLRPQPVLSPFPSAVAPLARPPSVTTHHSPLPTRLLASRRNSEPAVQGRWDSVARVVSELRCSSSTHTRSGLVQGHSHLRSKLPFKVLRVKSLIWFLRDMIFGDLV
ncbi:hypothetical protein PIB30_012945 [Stylosanthes scabra]|uniref:Uncharacterized protein n=1 Tax=Stylosanthes scabra TaxID=79078 RepID=A0ABU6Y6L0_9FABA|nr:hypothetical protein [Stylosanthes scabra]